MGRGRLRYTPRLQTPRGLAVNARPVRCTAKNSMSLLACRSFETCGKPGRPGTSQAFLTSRKARRGLLFFSKVMAGDSTHYLHSCCRHHNRTVTGIWLASLHDGKRGTCQVSQAASCLDRHQPLLDIRNRAFATATCGRAGASPTTRTRSSAAPYPTTRTQGRAGAFLAIRNR